MKCSYQYDVDPRYGWASVDLEGETTGMILVTDIDGLQYGFEYCEGKMNPVCICSAWNESECCCPNVDWTHNYE